MRTSARGRERRDTRRELSQRTALSFDNRGKHAPVVAAQDVRCAKARAPTRSAIQIARERRLEAHHVVVRLEPREPRSACGAVQAGPIDVARELQPFMPYSKMRNMKTA